MSGAWTALTATSGRACPGAVALLRLAQAAKGVVIVDDVHSGPGVPARQVGQR